MILYDGARFLEPFLYYLPYLLFKIALSYVILAEPGFVKIVKKSREILRYQINYYLIRSIII